MSTERDPTVTDEPDVEEALLETDPPEPPPPPAPRPMVVARWIQLVALPLGILALWSLAKASGPVLLLFIVAAVVALILNPVVSLVQRGRVPRGLAVAATYLGMLLVLAGAIALLATPIADQAQTLQKQLPKFADSANARLSDLQDTLNHKGIHVEIKKQGKTALETLSGKLGKATGSIATTATDILRTVATGAFGLILILVLSIYMLLYGERIGDLIRDVLPPGDGTREDDYPTRVQRAVAGYVRGQFFFSLLMGAGAGIGLWLLGELGIFPNGKTYALAFGIFFGLMELIPFVGPFLGALPPILVALFTDPITAVWVALFFVGLQQIEGHIVAPQIFGHTLRINPILVIFALLTGAETYGIIGALLALPIAAILRETVVYLRRHLVLEPWASADPLVVAGVIDPPRRGAPCPDCGTPAALDDAHCRSCGAALHVTSGA